MPRYRITILTDTPTTTRGKMLQRALQANDPSIAALLTSLGLPLPKDSRVIEDWHYISAKEAELSEIKTFIAELPGNNEFRGWDILPWEQIDEATS